jgi:phosphatidylinositol transfer protein SFH5
MELGVSKLDLASITTPIPDFGEGPDPYQGIQVHDYLNVSFLRMDKRIKAASKETINILSAHYPETLSRKFFVNVPLLMQWMFRAMQLLVKKETMEKFVVLSYGSQVASQLGPQVTKEYGGETGALAEVGETLKLAAEEPLTTEEPSNVENTETVEK